jgi:hypothetical protein
MTDYKQNLEDYETGAHKVQPPIAEKPLEEEV